MFRALVAHLQEARGINIFDPHSPPQRRTRSLPNHAHSLVATDRGRFIFDLPTYIACVLCRMAAQNM
jgi:hypothetical protein